MSTNNTKKTWRDLCRMAIGYQPPGPAPFSLTFTEAAQKNSGMTPETAAIQPEGTSAHRDWLEILPPEQSVPGPSLEDNLKALSVLLHYPDNKDIVLRRFVLDLKPPLKAAAVYLEGMCDQALQDASLFNPLMLCSSGRADAAPEQICDLIQHKLLPANQVIKTTDWHSVLDGIANGRTALLIEGCDSLLLAETKGWEKRGVESPKTETVIRGPQEAFAESLRTNTTLIRRRLRSPHLLTETFTLGRLSNITCAMMYLKGLANPALVAEVKRRLQGIKTDYISDSGMLEQFIEGSSWFLFPSTLVTERPDRAASMLAEGRVALIVEGDPFVLVVPTTFFALLHSPEDMSVRWPFSNFLRFLRTIAAIIALFLPGLYIALILFHQEMIPTDLLFSIAGSRERVPFPSAVELLVMELSFELVREAGVRVPGAIGQTIGIVGALILGQAAVSASIVSPIMIIIVAITALGGFAVPNNALGSSLRVGRFIFIILGATYGFIGIALGLVVIALAMAAFSPFGVPYLAPAAPLAAGGPDALYRAPVWEQELRPTQYEPLTDKKQPKKSRPWRRGGKS